MTAARPSLPLGSTAALLAAPRAPVAPHPILGPVGFSAHVEGTCRFELRRIFGLAPRGGERLLPWLLLNPSTADAAKNDPTLLRMIDFTWAWGFDGLIVLNLFPLRASRQAALRSRLLHNRPGSAVEERLVENRRVVASVLGAHDAALAAWGCGATGLSRAIAAELAVWRAIGLLRSDRPLFCLGTTRDGQPIHPLARGRSRVPVGTLPRLYAAPAAHAVATLGKDAA
jgi:hypothetical protein